MNAARYIDNCPIGCDSPIEETDIVLEQGPLERCSKCNQLFSQCTAKYFNSSMEEFNSSKGTWPPPENVKSLERSTKKTLKNITDIADQKLNRLKLLDVGCSNGAFIFTAGKFGIQCEGIEPAKEAALAAQKANLKVHHGYLEKSNLQKESYDVITLFEVIEHLKNPVELLNECNKLLKKNGIMVIRTANTDSWTLRLLKEKWHYLNISKHGGHISFFCKKSMTVIGDITGFSIIQFNTHSVTLCEKETASYFKYRLLKIFSELLNLPAKLVGKGQEMEVYLRKI
ncbi:MAG: class I SAM-dependent methyltransferase [Desulfobacteraceae bacterium]|nr:class I SAM-dependent methyltransferase [Desulfobacteraceae bacterium]